jgi:carbon-monoxide dehydrogenase medium subunit/xanthine dehydrogenase FAD-binding subunit
LAEALALWCIAPEGAHLIAGGTDLLPWAREGRAGDVEIPLLVDVSAIAELSEVARDGDRVRFGANTVFQQFLTDDDLRREMPCMPYCAIWFADDQIREQATLVGNLVNASPAADGTPAILTLNGEAEIARLDGDVVKRRIVPLSTFLEGPGKVALGADEIVTAVICDAVPGYGGAFEKVGQRRSLVISVACAACLVKASDDGATFADVRMAIGGVGPVPVRLPAVEAFLTGSSISSDAIRAASEMTDGLIRSRTRREYRKHVVEGFIERALLNALSDCGIEVNQQDTREMANA